jgi:hypothetical protein
MTRGDSGEAVSVVGHGDESSQSVREEKRDCGMLELLSDAGAVGPCSYVTSETG